MKAAGRPLQRALAQTSRFIAPARVLCSLQSIPLCALGPLRQSQSCSSAALGHARYLSSSPPTKFVFPQPRTSSPISTRSFYNSAIPRQARLPEEEKVKDIVAKDAVETESVGFELSEKAAKATQVNLSAKLNKDGKSGGKTGFGEIVRLLKIAKPESKWLGGAFMLLLLSSSITMAIPFSIGKILDAATNPNGGDMLFGLTTMQFYGALAAVLCCGAGANYGRIILLRLVGERIVARLRSQLFRRTYVQNAEFFDANRVGDLISRLSSDTIIVGKSITQNLSDGLRALVTGTAGIALMTYVSFQLTSVMAFMFPPIAVAAFFYGRNIRNLSRKIQRSLGSLTKVAEERLSNVRTSQAFAGEVLEVGRYNKGVRRIYNLGRKEALVSAAFFSSTGLIGNMTILSILYIGGSLVKSGTITIGELSSFLMYTAYAGSSMFGLSSFYSELMKGVGAASRLFELQDRKPTIRSTVGTKVTSARGIIKFNDVSFAYPTRPAVTIFDKISFDIKPGMSVAIVGPSGGGKSTISSLLLRFYDPTSGSITINGVDIKTMNLKSLRRRIGVVAQEPVLFSGTIAENIAYGKPTASKLEIVEAARRANCNFISDFPEGLETNVGPRGAMLSGGQKQRIAIARALLKKPDILILDEATSALDAESETAVNEALSKLMDSSTTTLSIAHRLSTIAAARLVIVLDNNGKVAETGTFKELVARDGPFKKLMQWQISGGEDPQQRPHHPRPAEEEQERLDAEMAEEGRGQPEEEELEELEEPRKSKQQQPPSS